MALKAGTVGIDPKYVDKNGKPVSDVDLSNYYTKSETDGKLDLKANQSYLTANNKKFQFAYDAETGKYGYKAGAQDDFHPFEEAGAGSPGWNKPAELITTDLTYTNCTYVSGGYYLDDDNNCYVDIVLTSNNTNSMTVSNMPVPNSQSGLQSCVGNTAEAVTDVYIDSRSLTPYAYNAGVGQIVVGSVNTGGKGIHIWGMYKKRTT